jgi:ParE toxin of type II toxin-antitoxin system, parDE
MQRRGIRDSWITLHFLQATALRIGDFRVFYEIREERIVRVLSVGHKEHNVLFIYTRTEGRDVRIVDLSKEEHSLKELLALAKSETLLIRLPSGEDFLLEQADEFDREVAALGSSDKFMSFLDARSKEEEDIPLSEARSKRGL